MPTPSPTHLLWIVPLTVLLALGGVAYGALGWCGDDAAGCRPGPGSALGSAIPPVVTAVVVGAVLGLVYGSQAPVADRVLRRRVGLAVGAGYVVLILAYLAITLGVNGWSS